MSRASEKSESKTNRLKKGNINIDGGVPLYARFNKLRNAVL